MKQFQVIACLLPVVALALGCAPSKEPRESVLAGNKELDERYISTFKARDLDGFMKTYLQSGRTVEVDADGNILRGYDAIKAYYSEFFASMESIDGRPLETEYEVYDGCVVGLGRFEMTLTQTGNAPMSLKGRFMDVREKHNGAWVFVKNMFVFEKQ